MNPSNFANMGAPPMGARGIPQQGPKGPSQAQAAQQKIFQQIQAHQQQFPAQGWQTTLPIQLRVNNVFQIFSAVRQVKLDMGIDHAIQVACSFEQKTFHDSSDRTQYDQKCHSKLLEIAQTRTQLATRMQHQLQNGQPQANMAQSQAPTQSIPNQVPNQISQQQMQYQMQQHRLVQQHQQQQQNHLQGMAMQPQAQMQMGNPQARPMQGMPANMPHPMPPQQQPKSQFTPEEVQQIHNLAQQLFQNYPKDQLNNLVNSLQQRQPGAPQQVLITNHFRTIAMQKLVDHKRTVAAQRAGQVVPGLNGGPIPQPNRPMAQSSGPPPNQQPTPVSAPKTFDPSFMGSVDQMRQSALRSQEAGQVVVPASQGNPQQQRAMGAAPQTVSQNDVSRPAQTPKVTQQSQQLWNPQQPDAFPNAANGIPPNVLQGQTGGLGNQARTPQQNANMPNLTRAFGPQNPQPNMQPQQNTPQMGAQNPPLSGQPTGETPQQYLQNGTPRPQMNQQQQQLQQMLQRMPEAERRAFVAKMQAQQRQRQQNAQGVPMAAQQTQTGQPMSIGTQSAQNPQATARPAQQTGPQQQPGTGQSQSQPQQPQQQPPQRNVQIQQQQKAAIAANNSLTNEQEQQMDLRAYPPGILNTGNALSQLPPGIKSWGQLKQWVKANSNTLPPGSEQKLRGLQGLHYQSLKKSLPQQAVRNAAPPAQMTAGPNQQPLNQQIPEPTAQEVKALRDRYPQLGGWADEQVRAIIMRQKQQNLMNQRHLAQQHAQFQMMQQGQMTQGQPQPASLAQPHQLPPSTQRPQPQQTPKIGGQAKAPTATGPQMPAQSVAPQKGTKRNSSDDVVEVPNPNINQQRAQAKPQPRAPAANMGQIPQKPAEVPKNQAAQHNQSNSQPSQAPVQKPPMTAEAIKQDQRYKEIFAEVRKAVPQRQPVPMNAETRKSMLATLANAREMIGRMGPILPVFWRLFKDEKGLRNLSHVYLTLAQQYKDEKVNQASPIEHFTVGPEELQRNVVALDGYFKTVMHNMDPRNMAGAKASQAAKETTPALSAANLEQHQNNIKLAREASMKKESNRAPPAPTSAQAPNPWGPSSPHGVPAAYGPNQLTQDKLQLPAKKKMKNNSGSAASTPAHLHGTPGPVASPLITKSPELQKTPAPVMLKCPVPNCSEAKGFATQGDLDKHMQKHEAKEAVIDDPLEFSLGAMRKALNLDENGKAKPKADVSASEAPQMKQSASMQSMKQEASTPMSRVPTGQSPASHSKTLQVPRPQGTPSNPLPNINLPGDPWADSLIKPEAIHEAFSPLATLAGPKTWTRIQDYLTPESTSTEATDQSKSSPRPSDVSENDAVKINMDMDKSWIPINWYEDGFGGPDGRGADFDFELLDLNVDGGAAEPMDWEAVFGESMEEAQARVDWERKKMEREIERGGPGLADEFVRVYGPGEINPPTRR